MRHLTKLWTILGIGLVALILQYGLNLQLYAQILVTVVGAVIALQMFIEMIGTLKSGSYGVDLLAITAVVATLAVSEYWAAMVILVMLVGGDSLEDYAAKKANSELKALLDNSPQIAHKLVEDDVIDLDVDEVLVGDKLLVRPGELVPVDSHIVKGESFFDESSLTGESRPLNKRVGDSLMSGSLNGDASVTIQVDKLAIDSQYQQLVKLVKEAKKTPSKFVRLADRYAVPFTLAAYVIAGIAWYLSKDPVRFAEVLVVASPCPLILAAPVAMVSGMSRASRNGIVVKTGDVLEKLARAKTGAFDKTGTITSGQLSVDKVVTLAGVKEEDLLAIIAGVETESNHILARSIVAYADDHGIDGVATDSLSEVTGKGVSAMVAGQKVLVGKLSFVAPDSKIDKPQQTAIYLSVAGKLWGYVLFIDHIRPEAAETMTTLQKLGVSHLMMLTGDQKAIATKVANQTGLTDVQADLLPQDKIAALKAVPHSDHPVFMVGDGVNDAPSLATADVGIAMGAHGSSAASESADVVILKDDLSKVAKAVIISQDTMRIARQSVLIGIFICLGLMLIASSGLIPAFIGAMFQEVVDTVSILWALKARYSHEQ
ncbi:P-ATPase superfamily P-type ATPase cadmium transporter [Ligilactobacillus agilis DSM 20509]|uniref:Cd(2+)-exporting ATPase n=1 Tax=Ligilactobacillus agilis DSM 20509 TaxID=1423718 RepID=A0A0R2ACX6_9LACO|nr:heavy metal translocating P-type ATPase [Ligilactobacillus agilis]KRM64565.1 P-ATPase superfamily P-type ATPase cadmium transporter [Ligilactobacillus agilis DSM 20509]